MKLALFKRTIRKVRVDNEYFLFIVHLTKTMEPFITEWIKSYKTIGVISIPYSENANVKLRISKLANIYEVSDYKKIPAFIRTLCKEHAEKKIILVEIGGYSASVSEIGRAHV